MVYAVLQVSFRKCLLEKRLEYCVTILCKDDVCRAVGLYGIRSFAVKLDRLVKAVA
jgi:hypothetical protein